MALARTGLRGAARRVADEEDAALSAFDSFCRRAAQGQFPDLKDRDGLWALLVVITARKAAELGCSVPTGERRLRMIRRLLKDS